MSIFEIIRFRFNSMLKSQNNDDRKKKKKHMKSPPILSSKKKGIKMSREEQIKMSHNRKEAYGTVY